MEKLIGLFVFFTISIILFLLGYNFTFNTIKTNSKFISLAGYKEGSKMFKALSSESNIHWMKICGIVIIIFALMLFTGMIILIVKRYCR